MSSELVIIFDLDSQTRKVLRLELNMKDTNPTIVGEQSLHELAA